MPYESQFEAIQARLVDRLCLDLHDELTDCYRLEEQHATRWGSPDLLRYYAELGFWERNFGYQLPFPGIKPETGNASETGSVDSRADGPRGRTSTRSPNGPRSSTRRSVAYTPPRYIKMAYEDADDAYDAESESDTPPSPQHKILTPRRLSRSPTKCIVKRTFIPVHETTEAVERKGYGTDMDQDMDLDAQDFVFRPAKRAREMDEDSDDDKGRFKRCHRSWGL